MTPHASLGMLQIQEQLKQRLRPLLPNMKR